MPAGLSSAMVRAAFSRVSRERPSAQRSGIFYVIDRTNGAFLLAKPFVQKMTWAKGFEKDGTPILAAGNTPTVRMLAGAYPFSTGVAQPFGEYAGDE